MNLTLMDQILSMIVVNKYVLNGLEMEDHAPVTNVQENSTQNTNGVSPGLVMK